MTKNTPFEDHEWQTICLENSTLLLQPDIPDWIVVSNKTAALFSLAKRSNKEDFSFRLLQHAMAKESATPYSGRYSHLNKPTLKECWFHLTDNCNLSCRHCLFSASPAKKRSIDSALLQKTVQEALDLGCRLFSFTGGEPFLYPNFIPFLQSLLQKESNCHVAVLTNGMLLSKHMESLQQMDRLHLQISLDGLEQSHDALRGKGSYRKLLSILEVLQKKTIAFTLSVAISRENIHDLADLVKLASTLGAASIHLLFHFVRGKGSKQQYVEPSVIYPILRKAWILADSLGLKIDNVESIRSQIFGTPGTRYDLSNTAWESLAVGPDGMVYPSPALVGMEQCNCGSLTKGLSALFYNSPVLEQIRKSTLLDAEQYRTNPLKFLVGGGDIDHSFMHSGKWVGHDPYVELYNNIGLDLISDQAAKYASREQLIILRMGDVRYDCPEEDKEASAVSLTHCNCLISLASSSGHGSVREFYASAALQTNKDIINPLAPAQQQAEFIPELTKQHSYGCGSPVTDGAPQKGEVLVDLGSGGGVECFMASEAVGKEGKVFGIDMTDEMLQLANSAKTEVAHRLGYQNVEFKKGFLESIPLRDNEADVVISNCVINLSPDKRMTYQEIYRILKPGGRLIVSDIVTDRPIPTSIRNNVRYRGECLGGAMQQEELVAMMRAAGFVSIQFIKRFPYREVEGMDFYSLTYQAIKSEQIDEEQVQVIYRGPHGAVYTETGNLFFKGKLATIPSREAALLDDSFFLLDRRGNVTNIKAENSCCSLPQEVESTKPSNDKQPQLCCEVSEKKSAGCMVCGEELHYFNETRTLSCSYCGREVEANASCTANHFVCDSCHQEAGLEITKTICKGTKETDLIALLKLIRSHPAIPMHGPEHHAMMPGIILAAYRNGGGDISEKHIDTGIERGAKLPGGSCGFWGACGAAVGAGIAVSTLFEATPLTPAARQQAQSFTSKILAKIATYKGGRCCQRETWLALTKTAKLSTEIFGLHLPANDILECNQYVKNKECIRKACPLWEKRVKKDSI